MFTYDSLITYTGGVVLSKTAQALANAQPSHIGQSFSNPVTRTKTMTKYQRKRKSNPGKKVATVAAVKRMIGNVVETKQFFAGPTVTGMAAGTVYSVNLTAQVVQGTLDGNRVGDSILLDHLALRGKFNSPTTPVGHYQCRILVVYSGEEYNPAATFSSSGLAYTELMGTPYTATQVIGILNHKAITVLYDNTVEVSSQITNVTNGVTFGHVVNLKGAKFPYQALSNTMGKTKNLYLIAIAGGTSTTADFGNVVINYKLQYKDA